MAELRPDPTAITTLQTPVSTASTRDRTDPSRDGLVGIYALRILDRGVDPRTLVAEHRAIRYGLSGRTNRPHPAAPQSRPITEVGRGAMSTPALSPDPVTTPSRQPAVARRRKGRRLTLPTVSGLAALLVGPQPAPSRNPA